MAETNELSTLSTATGSSLRALNDEYSMPNVVEAEAHAEPTESSEVVR